MPAKVAIAFIMMTYHALTMANTFKAQCDLVGDHLKKLKAKDQAACWTYCEADTQCKGAVYVSGWDRCFLKSKVLREAPLRFFSGEKNTPGTYDRDYSGKDLRRHVVATKEACGQRCSDENACIGFTYLEGYRDCWIKNTKGQLFQKVFYCRVKAD